MIADEDHTQHRRAPGSPGRGVTALPFYSIRTFT